MSKKLSVTKLEFHKLGYKESTSQEKKSEKNDDAHSYYDEIVFTKIIKKKIREVKRLKEIEA